MAPTTSGAHLRHRRVVFSARRSTAIRKSVAQYLLSQLSHLGLSRSHHGAGANLVVPVKSFLVIVTALLMLGGLNLFVNQTRLGTAIRAVAQDPDTASLMGIP